MRKNLNLSIGLIMMAFAIACDDKEINPPSENPPGSKVTVEFGEDLSIPENSTDHEVIIQFSKAASLNGNISIEVDTDFPDAYTLNPAISNDLMEVSVSKGAEYFVFNITPTDNELLDGNKTITFTLTEVSEEFIMGNRQSMVITIIDDEMPPQQGLVYADFTLSGSTLREDNPEGIEVDIALSTASALSGEIAIRLSSTPDGVDFNTIPALNNEGSLWLEVAAGTTELKFIVIPINDDLLKNHQVVLFEILGTEGFIEPGMQMSYTLNILDKELLGKPKSFETAGGGWKARQTYFYDPYGRISRVEWENETPGKRNGTSTYDYAENGLIEHINQSPSRDEYFYQENGRIVKSEVIGYGDVVSYSFYDYDPAGNIGARVDYHKNPQGEFEKSLIYLYLYYDNGNIYKQLTYIPGETEGEEVLISTRTFDGYYPDKVNHFPMFEVIPGIVSQPNLPTYHRVQEDGSDLQYHLSYEFDEAGNALRRTVTGSGANEGTVYTYY